MATPSQAASDTHRRAQTGLSLVAVRAIQHAFASLDLHRLKATLPEFTQGIAAIVRHYAPASSVLAIEHYTEQRLAAGISGSFRPLPGDPVPLSQIASNVQWATKPLWGPNPDIQAATTNLEGAVARLVQDVGRNTTIDNAENDHLALGWAREAREDACWFCAMLATRGAVYSSAEAAGRVKASDPVDKGGLGIPDAKGFVNRYHDHCHCSVVPVFNTFEKQAHVREWTALWNSSTRGVTGMEAKQAAFRAAYKKFQAERAAAELDLPPGAGK